jgi:N-formylglutamate deformylase
MTPVTVSSGNSPIVLGLPHTGTFVPDEIAHDLNANGLKLSDTDWHIDRLYADLLPNVTTVTANFHRYVIDANRGPDGASLYPGQNTTGLVPMTDFDGQSIWDAPPTQDDVITRIAEFHAPYHAALQSELMRLRAIHGVAILYDCHSIRSNIPFLFDGTLPDFNIGTNAGATCAPVVQELVERICTAPGQSGARTYTSVTNGRFKGGWTTRHYGNPGDGIHAIQMELAQSTYLKAEKAPWEYDDEKASVLRDRIRDILAGLESIALKLGDRE